ncbi:hypothetical protein JP09_001305 [Dehalogenimonas etheniformans]|uniref:TRASH domain-containing protein n=2 Tax=Dehalogenimonas etheniformans TaxID=1536648 RepID=A0A2P5P8C0_9CHLR|nr:hypothetical protein JP09_001305 [Dehalogenimonas etheniformans]
MALKDMADKGKLLGKKVVDKVDMTCDTCGKMMKPGGNIKKNIQGADYQFCSDACVTAFKPGSKTK